MTTPSTGDVADRLAVLLEREELDLDAKYDGMSVEEYALYWNNDRHNLVPLIVAEVRFICFVLSRFVLLSMCGRGRGRERRKP